MREAEYFEGFAHIKPDLYHLAISILRDDSDAEEVLQTALYKGWRGLKRFRGDSKLSSWLYSITRNEALMALRKRSTVPVRAEICEEIRERMPDTKIIPPERIIDARNKLRKMEEDFPRLRRQDLYMAIECAAGMSPNDLAVVLNISRPAVKSRLHRTRLILRKKASNG